MKNLILVLLSGVLLALGWPTYGFPLVLFFAFVPLLYAEFKIRNFSKKHMKWKVFGSAYLSFFLWNAITTYWVSYSTLFGGIFAVLANSLLMSLVFMLYHIVAKRSNFGASATFLISMWMVFEKIHLSWEFSWPWLNLGNAFSEFTNWVQWYEYTGTFGGTLWIWLANIALFKGLLVYIEFRKKELLTRALVKTAFIILIPLGISYFILWNYQETEKSIEAVILQPNINPYTEKYNTTDDKIGELLLKMSQAQVSPKTSLLVAPETVFADGTKLPAFNQSEAAFYSREILRKHKNLNFLCGISFYDRFQDASKVRAQSNQLGPNDWFNDYNSAFLMNTSHLENPQIYHKSKLVVGVENFPYQDILKPILGNIMIDLGGTVAMKTTQAKREVFKLSNNAHLAPIICYESIYGQYVGGYIKNGAQFLSIITNDAWWGDTQGHKQHLSYARLRAVETRRDVVRSANTGISAFIDQTGKIKKELAYTKRGSLKGRIHLNTCTTFYVKYGDYLARIAKFLALFTFLFAMVKYKRTRL